MPLLTWIPFTPAWKSARSARAEVQWEQALQDHRRGEPSADGRLAAALRAGASPTYARACSVLHPPAPQAMKVLLDKNIGLRPGSSWDSKQHSRGDTLLHEWARCPAPMEADARVTQMTRLLWREPVRNDPLSVFGNNSQCPYESSSDVAWWANRAGETPRMLAARHGHWSLLKLWTPAEPGKRSVWGPTKAEVDAKSRHWVDHWATGVIERHREGTLFVPSPQHPAVRSLLESQDVYDLNLLSESGTRHPAIARLLAAGVPHSIVEMLLTSHPDAKPQFRSETALGPNEGPLNPSHAAAYSSMGKALAPDAWVGEIPGVEGKMLASAMVETQPMAALEWLMESMSYYREDPNEGRRTMHVRLGGAHPQTPTTTWVKHPEHMLVALERKWFGDGALFPDHDPVLKAFFQDMLYETTGTGGAIWAALERNYPNVVEQGFKQMQMARKLDANLPEEPSTSPRRARM